EQWEQIVQPPEQSIEKPYIFVYDLYRSKDILPVVEKLARKSKIRYVNYKPIFLLRKIRFPNLKFNYYTQGPAEFLWLLKESNFVITSSFHGVAFSVIFKKPFYAILWDRKDMIRQNGRIIDLLGKLGLKDRAFVDPREILKRGFDENIDWKYVHERLNELREDSISWLLNALNDESTDTVLSKFMRNVSFIQKGCAGCFSCYNICPADAIEMIFSYEGFYVPSVNNNLCTNCGLCVKVCPVINEPSQQGRFSKPKVYAAWSLDESIRMNSSSGGIYPELAKIILENGGVVFAVAWNKKEWLPEHIQVNNVEGISQTVGSKYVQSKAGDVYEKIIEIAKNGKSVLFIGTPCQVAGLKNIVEQTGTIEDKVFTVDLVCLGVPSPVVFKKYVDENFKHKIISSISFRSKIFGWSKPCIVVNTANGNPYSMALYKDSFGCGFGRRYFLNLVCYDCPFSRIPRQGDITLGDFWGVPEKYKDERGVSVVLVNSQKGEKLFGELIEKRRIFAEQVSIETATKSNPRIVSGKMDIPEKRAIILREIQNKSWHYISKKYIKPPVGLRGFTRRGLSLAKRIVKKIIKR
ncbi:MAG: Coenzyme F420 hydrogenase/dehydrogenase, beta subunit C-terminal domain, partial [candidate division WOR-3 bacterium]